MNIKWISVKKLLPKTREIVYVWDIKNGVKQDYYSRAGISGWANSIQKDISHWMNKKSFELLVNPVEYIGDAQEGTGAFEGQ